MRTIQGIFLLLLTSLLFAQDPQFSQYYNAPLYLNPAFTGTGEDTRVGLNYRAQWPGLNPSYTISSFWADHAFPKNNTSVGLLVRRDLNSSSKLRSMEVGLLSAYSVYLGKGWAVRPGLQVSYATRDLNFSSAIFGDGLQNDGAVGVSNDPLINGSDSFSYLDVSTGIIAFSQNLWIGTAVHHLNRPDQSFSNGERHPLPMRFSVQGGYKFLLEERYIAFGAPIQETSLTPTFNYLSQGEFDQLDLGLYYRWDPFMMGLWYRGIPVKRYRLGYSNTEGLILMGGFNYKGLAIYYSYDINLGQLRTISAGSHEISLQYSVLLHKKVKKRKDGLFIPCPNLDKRYKRTRIG
jgi:type IX secretion system PorP/SprF family membrane protein